MIDQKSHYALYIVRMHSEYIVAGAHVAFSVGNQNESFYGIHQDILPIQLCTAVKQAAVLYNMLLENIALDGGADKNVLSGWVQLN